MKKDRKNLSWLIRELKRRNVFRVVAMYAPGAFVLLELMDIITPALSLPPWIVTLTIVVLAIGFPVTVILAWIFDITPEGVRRTDDLDAEAGTEPETQHETGRRRMKASDVVIAVLVVALVILLYPKIFSRDKLADVRDLDGRIALAVLPFENMSGDTLFNVWSGGFQNLLISNLSNSQEISVRQYEAVNGALEDVRKVNYASLTPVLKGEIADKLDTRTLVIGTILKAGNIVRINAQLLDAETEEIYKTYLVEGHAEDDLFAMADSLADLIRNFVEIKKITEDENTPIYRAFTYKGSSEAFRYFIHGMDALMAELDMQQSIQWFNQAIDTDSTFITAYVMLSYAYAQAGNAGQSKYWCNAAYAKKDQLPVADKLLVEHLHASYYGLPEENIRITRQLVDLDEMNPMYYHMLAVEYYKINEFAEALPLWEKALEIHREWGSDWQNPYIYFMMGDAYHQLGNHQRENEIYNLGITVIPQDYWILEYQAICAFSRGENEKAEEIVTRYQDLRKNVTYCTGAMIFSGLGFIYTKAGMLDEAEEYYRETTVMEPENPNWKNNLSYFLVDNDIDVDEGLELNEQLLERFPGHPALLDTKGWGLLKKGAYEEALAVLNQAWENRANYDHNMYTHLQKAEEAVENLN
ncbi:MAG: hypothetical protein ACWGNV_02335 [Bacteroidales bacterium]